MLTLDICYHGQKIIIISGVSATWHLDYKQRSKFRRVFPSDHDVGYTSFVMTDIAYFWNAGIPPSSYRFVPECSTSKGNCCPVHGVTLAAPLTSTLDVLSVQLYAPTALPPRKTHPVLIYCGAVWGPDPGLATIPRSSIWLVAMLTALPVSEMCE
jgi:hypothetical protein